MVYYVFKMIFHVFLVFFKVEQCLYSSFCGLSSFSLGVAEM